MNCPPNKDIHIVIGFSGGKDSVATWLYLKELGYKNIQCVFCDVGHEFPETHEYLDLLKDKHNLPLVKIYPRMIDMLGELKPHHICERMGLDINSNWQDEILNIEKLSILKKRFPSSMARFCTHILKIKPSARWIKDNCNIEDTVRCSGVRAQESAARAQQDPWRLDEVTGCYLWLPIHQWTHEGVFEIHKKYGIPPNPLYLQGMGRVGCAPCIMARKGELKQIALRKPEAFDKLYDMEKRVGEALGHEVRAFFSSKTSPKRFHNHVDEKSGKSFADASGIRNWALGLPILGQEELRFEEDWTEDTYSCSSQYGLCE